MDILLFAAWCVGVIVANAFGRRFAGGLLGQWFGNIGGTQVGRLAQALVAGASVALLAPVWWWGAPVAAGVFVGAVIGFPNKGGMMPQGINETFNLSLMHGLLAVLPIMAVFAAIAVYTGEHWLAYGMWFLGIAGIARGPIYRLAQVWQPHIPVLGLNRDGLPDPPAWAEYWSGAAVGAAFVLTFTLGAP